MTFREVILFPCGGYKRFNGNGCWLLSSMTFLFFFQAVSPDIVMLNV